MILPYLSETQNASKKYSVVFRGINYGEATQDGEFAHTHNISTDLYPCITQRAERIKGETPLNNFATDIHAKGNLLIIATQGVYYDGKFLGTVDARKKQIVTVGNYIIIFPDKKYYKVPTTDADGNVIEGEFGEMKAECKAEYYRFTDSTIKITEYTVPYKAFPFKEGDAVTISGSSKAANNKTAIIRSKTDYVLTFDANTFEEGTDTSEITITRDVPDLDFICESNYRLWGTKGNTIYASKFSDPFNFQVFDGLSSDSYYIDVGSDGEFTGCIPFTSHICFFKENTLHKIYGTKPSNFQVTTANVYGVQSGSERSMQIINETLFYKGVGGIYAYTGGIPELISEKLGNNRYSDAVACSDGEKYYVSMRRGDEWNFFTYDISKNIWLREDNTHATDMTFYNGKIYYLDSEGSLYYIDKSAKRNNIEWSATFCTMHETINERKGYSKFHLRMDLSDDAWLAVDIKTDNDTQWRQIYTTHNEKAKTVSIPIIPTRCDSIDIRLRGKGVCTIKTFIREFTTGSDV